MSTMNEMMHHFPGHDMRATERQVTVLINAGLSCGDRDGLCRIRNLSSSGLKVETMLAPEIDEPVRLQLRSGRMLDGVVRWTQGNEVGIAFAALDTNDILNDRVPTETVARDGAFPNFAREGWAILPINHQKLRCPLQRISLSDITLADAPDLPVGTVMDVEIDGLSKGLAKLVHRGVDDARFMFTQPLNYRALEAWLQGQVARREFPGAGLPNG